MGQNPSAHLFYGFYIEGVGETLPWDVGKDYDDRSHLTWRDQWLTNHGHDPEAITWNEQEALMKDMSCIILEDGSEDASSYYVAIQASVKTGDWEAPVPITSLEVKPEWDEQLKQFATEMHISESLPRKQGWFMICYYG